MCLYVLSSMLLMSIKISTLKLCPVRPYLVLCMAVSNTYCVVFLFFYLRLVYGGVQHILRCVFVFFVFVLCMAVSNTYCVVFFLSSSCVWRCPTHIMLCFHSSRVPYGASFSGLSFFDCPFSILQRLFTVFSLTNNLPMSPHSRSKEWHVLLKYNNRS